MLFLIQNSKVYTFPYLNFNVADIKDMSYARHILQKSHFIEITVKTKFVTKFLGEFEKFVDYKFYLYLIMLDCCFVFRTFR